MLRTQIMLSDDERALLDRAVEETGRSMASLIREAVRARYGARATESADVAAVHGAFGAWSGDRPEGAAFVDDLRPGTRIEHSE